MLITTFFTMRELASQANLVGADESLMLDPHGFVATCNSVNFFCIRKGEVWTPTSKYQVRTLDIVFYVVHTLFILYLNGMYLSGPMHCL